MDDLKQLTLFIEKKYGWQCYQIAIHRDEGYEDKETGEIEYNLHAHLEFLMLDKDGVKDALDCPKNSFLNCQLF